MTYSTALPEISRPRKAAAVEARCAEGDERLGAVGCEVDDEPARREMLNRCGEGRAADCIDDQVERAR